MSPTSETFYQYFYHPESDAYVTCPTDEVEKFTDTADGALCHTITLEEWLKGVTKAIELPNDPQIKGILKNAKRYVYDKEVIVGDLYFNPAKQIPDGTNIHTSRIEDIRSDGLYVTKYAKFYVMWASGHEEPRRG